MGIAWLAAHYTHLDRPRAVIRGAVASGRAIPYTPAPMMRLALMLLYCLLAGWPATVPAQAADSAETRRDLERLRARIRTLEQQVDKDVARSGELQRELRDVEKAAGRARSELARVRGELVAVRGQLAQLAGAARAAEAALARQRVALAGHLRTLWMNGPAGGLAPWLGDEGPGVTARRLAWLDYVARARQALHDEIARTLATLEDNRRAAAARQTELAALEAGQQRELARLEAARAGRAQVLARLDAATRTQDQQLRQLKDEARTLDRLLRELQRQLARSPSPPRPAAALGRGRWPVKGPVLGAYGQPRAGGQLRWQGVLIGASAGTPVVAPRAGRVAYADWLPGLGLLLVLDHGGGWLSLYGHNQVLARAVGDEVAAGEELARVGDTGGQGRPALYFEVRRNGTPQDPAAWVR